MFTTAIRPELHPELRKLTEDEAEMPTWPGVAPQDPVGRIMSELIASTAAGEKPVHVGIEAAYDLGYRMAARRMSAQLKRLAKLLGAIQQETNCDGNEETNAG